MSKSKGNVLDPIEIMHDFGTDAVRMALVTCASQSRQIDLDRRRFEEYKNFANKLWNGARFIFMNLEDVQIADLEKSQSDLLLEDRWILTKLSESLDLQQKSLDQYFFDKAANSITEFFWNDFCANYLEISKPILSKKQGSQEQRLMKQKILLSVLCQVLTALHPFIPFVTEALFGKLKAKFGGLIQSKDALLKHFTACMQSSTLALAPMAKAMMQDQKAVLEFEHMQHLLHHIREMRGELQIPPQEMVTVYIENPESFVADNKTILSALTKIESIHFAAAPSQAIVATKSLDKTTTSVLLPESLIGKEIERLEKICKKSQKKLKD